MVLRHSEYGPVKDQLRRILSEAEAVDATEDSEGYAGETRIGKKVEKRRMRDILQARCTVDWG